MLFAPDMFQCFWYGRVSNAVLLFNELPFPCCVCHSVYNSYGFSLSQVNGSSCVYIGLIYRFNQG